MPEGRPLKKGAHGIGSPEPGPKGRRQSAEPERFSGAEGREQALLRGGEGRAQHQLPIAENFNRGHPHDRRNQDKPAGSRRLRWYGG